MMSTTHKSFETFEKMKLNQASLEDMKVLVLVYTLGCSIFSPFSHQFCLGSHVMRFSTLIRKRIFFHYDVTLRCTARFVYVIFRNFSISRKRYKLGTCNLRQSMQNNRFPIRVQ